MTEKEGALNRAYPLSVSIFSAPITEVIFMKEQDLILEHEAITNEAVSLQQAFQAVSTEWEEKMAEAREANERFDFETVEARQKELQSIIDRRAFILGLMERNAQRMRRLMVALYGPEGGRIFDEIYHRGKGS
jgi:hypothetical protein